MDERIKEHLKQLNRYRLLLWDIRETDFQKFMDDPMLRGSAERFLQLAIESCLNTGNRLISLFQLAKPVEPPATYADIFVQMKSLGVIDHEFCERLVKMAKFRNRLVHLYWELEPEMVFQIIRDNLDDFKQFQDEVVAFLKRNDVSNQSANS